MKTTIAMALTALTLCGVPLLPAASPHAQSRTAQSRTAESRAAQRQAAARAIKTIEIDVTEVTAPALTVAPDDRSLIFSALGLLYRLPADGGAATQLTFGASYDSDPVFSPDGRRVAFVSNRDGSGSNIFVLDLATKQVTPVTREQDATRPAWSPDGQTIAYARTLAREEHALERMPGFADTGLREIRTVPVAGGQPASVGPPRSVETLFYLPDGRLAWSVREQAPGGGMFQTTKQSRIEARAADDAIVVLATTQGDVGRVALGPAGDGVYYAARGNVQWLPFAAESTPTPGPKLQDGGARLAVARGGRALYFGDRGAIWRAPIPSGEPQRLPLTAAMTLDVWPRVDLAWQAPPATAASVPVRAVLAPQLSPDGKRLAVMAAGFLWEQPVGGGAAQRLFESGAFSRDPAYSPDGRRLAFVSSEHGKRELRLYDFDTKQTRTLVTVGGASWPLAPTWSADGQRIVYQHTTSLGAPFRINVINVADGSTQEIAQSVGSWVARPHFSRDGRSIYFTSRPGKLGALYRVAAEPKAQPEVLTDLARHVHEGLVSPDGAWMAHRRNSEIWIAPLAQTPVRDAQLRRISEEGGRAFSFTPDSSAILYAAGGRVWRQPLDGSARRELPVRLALPRTAPPPLLVTHVRVLDFEAGRFSDDTSMFVEGGRIRWIGSEQGRNVPANTVRLDGGGRFAIPGLFDAHVHSAWQNQQTNEDAFIAFGVTSVRDTGSTLDVLNALDDRSDVTSLPAPRYFYSGEIFEGMMPHWGDAFYTIGTEAEARAEVRHLKAWGADFVKIYPSLPWRLQQIVSDEAQRVRLPIVGHGLSPEEITRRVLWGSTSVEHSAAVYGTYEDIHKLLAAAGTAADLTLSVGGGVLMRASDPDWSTSWRVREYVPEESRRPMPAGGPFGGGEGQTRDQLLALYKPRFDRIVNARQRGVVLTGGTDSLMGGVHFGLALHWEIAQFADAGVPAIDVLRMATQGGAALVGASADLGSLAPGKLADIVLLDGNPLENIRHTQKVWQVIKGGRVYDPTKLRPGVSAATTGQ